MVNGNGLYLQSQSYSDQDLRDHFELSRQPMNQCDGVYDTNECN